MTDNEALALLRKCIKHYAFYVQEGDDAGEVLRGVFSCYGGDSTWFILGHYKDTIGDVIRREVLADPSLLKR